MEKMTLHLNAHCKLCSIVLLAGTEHYGYWSGYLREPVLYCDPCYNKYEDEKRRKESERKFANSARGRRVDKLRSDKAYKRMSDYLG